MATIRKASVTAKRRFAAPAETVFNAWLDPYVARAWLFTLTDSVVRIEIDPQVGGHFTIVDRRKDCDVTHEGEYLEILAPERIRFRFWLADLPNDVDTVTADIVPDESGAVLTVTHDLAPAWAGFLEQTRNVWSQMLELLAKRIKA